LVRKPRPGNLSQDEHRAQAIMVSAVLRDQSSRPRLVTVSEIVGNRRIGPLLANRTQNLHFCHVAAPGDRL
jgi:hypothetical protein